MRRDRGRPVGRHATPYEASDPRAADRSPPPVPHHADLFSPGAAPSDVDADEESFETLIEQHREALYGYVYRLTGGDEVETDCIVKETFYRAAQDPSRLVQRTSSVRPWLVLLARTAYQDGERSAAPADPEPEAPVETTVVRAMDSLSRMHREILVELFYRGTSLEEAAHARGVGVDTVKSRLYYAMRALRIVLDQQVADRPSAPVESPEQ
jgi:RNA polymerase sigma-70 factor (ECF subfamily)